MIDKVTCAIDRWKMIDEGETVIVALSGGADSVALTDILYSLREKYKFSLRAAHLNHGIRGEEAERDEAFCKILCEKYQIPFSVKHADVPRLAAERKVSEELCGREERYRFFSELSEQYRARIATAHTASDNAETLIFHLTRGASVTGAAGIPPVRERIIRPLITVTRAEIEAYCELRGLDYVTDSTNLTDDYTRNIIRHRVMPVLRDLNPRAEEAFTRFCESAALARDHLRGQAKALLKQAQCEYGWSAAVLLNADDAVLAEALVMLCREQPETRHLDLLRSILLSGGAVDFGAETAVCRQGVLRFISTITSALTEEIPLNGKAAFTYGGIQVAASIQNSDEEIKNIVFRCRRGGERFTFAKRGVTKPLRKAMNEKKIPAERRDSALLLCSGNEVLWCDGLGFSKQGEEMVKNSGLTVETRTL